MSAPRANPLQPPIPAPGEARPWTGLSGCAPALALTGLAAEHTGPVVAVVADEHQAYRLEAEARFFAGEDLPVHHFPDWETLPYDVFSPHGDIVSERLAILHRLPRAQHGLLIVAADTLLQRLPPTEYLDARVLLLQVGERLDPVAMRERLEAAGYAAVSEVREHGEFALRGAVLDLFPMGQDEPFRLDLFDDEIESIRRFDPETQRSTDRLDKIRLLPAREFPLDDESIKAFRARYRQYFAGDPSGSTIYRDISRGVPPGGIEYYLPLFFDKTSALLDYCPPQSLLIEIGDVGAALDRAWQEIHDRHEQRSVDTERPLLAPEMAFVPVDDIRTRLGERTAATIAHDGTGTTTRAATDFGAAAVSGLAGSDDARTGANLVAFLQDFGNRVLITGDSPGRREAMRDWLRGLELQPDRADTWLDFITGDTQVAVIDAPLEAGFVHAELAVIAEPELTGSRPPTRRRRKAVRDPETAIQDLADLAPGAPVVHADHGVGRYLGLQRLTAGGVETEFLAMEYADGDKLYVPVGSLHLVHRFTGADAETAPMHRLGSERWSKAKKKAAERARDVAAELLELQARRAAQTGAQLAAEPGDYQRFCAGFPFTETEDQSTAIEQVLSDMAASTPMDRVVCGDVGFGKTEVALRAAFAAVSAGYQVCVLVPTTLLAQQHAQTFADRFADWPVRMGSLSRLQSATEKQKTLDGLHDGSLDIIIGTHRLLRKDIKFERLGLLIVDEEQRFGVRHKEQIKALRAQVDLLTLTATPIPRTLNMSLAGLRDLSIIATPPEQRLAIQTFVSERDGSLIQEAFRRELRRGGQVYFLHNEVRDIEKAAREVGELVPEARVRIAHGQMHERELEQVMLDFYHRRFDVLVCTTIIESGIDVPSANTIVIERADSFGLAQLHQLRGRVGRSHHRAYAYLMTPPRKAMTADAVKRLDALASLGDLGAGFTLATHDLEIRGAGELLGEDQSGQMEEIGFDLYNQLLQRAIGAYKRGEVPEPDTALDNATEVELGVSTLLPEDYIPDVHVRLVLYKRISAAADEATLRNLKVELIDRFGLLPQATEHLFAAAGLRLRATPLGITKIEAAPDVARLHFGKQTKVEPASLIALIQSDSRRYRLDGDQKLTVFRDMPEIDDRVAVLNELLDRLGADAKDGEEHKPAQSAEQAS